MEINLFTYGTLLNENKFNSVLKSYKFDDYEIKSIEPAFVEGKMFSFYGRFPFVVKPDQGKRKKAPYIVYGGLIKLEASKHIFKALDSYEGCSLYAFGVNRDTDLYHREKTNATTIVLENGMIGFLDFEFEPKETVECFIYYGNMKHEWFNREAHRRRSGHLWKSFFMMTEWEKFKN